MGSPSLPEVDGPERAALAFADVETADELAHLWGEAVWTEPLLFSIAVFVHSPTSPLGFLASSRPAAP